MDNQLEILDKNLVRAKISSLEKEMLARTEEHVHIETIHHFSKGLYAREILIPKHTLLTGKIHKFECLNVISKGKIIVASIEGVKTIEAPFTFTSKPGVKRVGFALEETVWTTFHATEKTDLAEIEEEVIAKDYSEVPGITKEELNLIEEAIQCLG